MLVSVLPLIYSFLGLPHKLEMTIRTLKFQALESFWGWRNSAHVLGRHSLWNGYVDLTE
jgi:hypothetical protein